MRLHLRVIACEILARPLYRAASESPHVVDVGFLRRGLHDTPALLRERLQAEIEAAASADPGYDAVVLVYGLCGTATAGIRASRLPLVVPRAHDCLTLLLGSRARYEAEFSAHPGTYWYSSDSVERSAKPFSDSDGPSGIGSGGSQTDAEAYADYVARFGQDSADYLVEVLGGWRSAYDRAGYIDTGLGPRAEAEALVRAESERAGWGFEGMAADLGLFRRLLEGDWADDFLVLQPGQRLEMSYDSSVVRAEPAAGTRPCST
jgi:hypothetical protein